MHTCVNTLPRHRRHERRAGAFALLVALLALAMTGPGLGHLPTAAAATTQAGGQPGSVTFWTGTGPAMLVGVPQADLSTRSVVTTFQTSRMWLDPAPPAASGSDLTQSVDAELRLQRWDDAAARWATIETKRSTVDLSKEPGTSTGNTYGEIAPIRFATKTAGTSNGTLTWATYRVVGSFTWVRNSDRLTLGTLTVTPKELNEVSCGRAPYNCRPGANSQTSYLWAA